MSLQTSMECLKQKLTTLFESSIGEALLPWSTVLPIEHFFPVQMLQIAMGQSFSRLFIVNVATGEGSTKPSGIFVASQMLYNYSKCSFSSEESVDDENTYLSNLFLKLLNISRDPTDVRLCLVSFLKLFGHTASLSLCLSVPSYPNSLSNRHHADSSPQ